jgi:hypothetical protein
MIVSTNGRKLQNQFIRAERIEKEDRNARTLIGGEQYSIVLSSTLIGQKTCISIPFFRAETLKVASWKLEAL